MFFVIYMSQNNKTLEKVEKIVLKSQLVLIYIYDFFKFYEEKLK